MKAILRDMWESARRTSEQQEVVLMGLGHSFPRLPKLPPFEEIEAQQQACDELMRDLGRSNLRG
jgi:hypothetical protein